MAGRIDSGKVPIISRYQNIDSVNSPVLHTNTLILDSRDAVFSQGGKASFLFNPPCPITVDCTKNYLLKVEFLHLSFIKDTKVPERVFYVVSEALTSPQIVGSRRLELLTIVKFNVYFDEVSHCSAPLAQLTAKNLDFSNTLKFEW